MSKYGFDDLAIAVDNSSGTPVTLTSYITEVNGVDVNAITEESTPAGVSWAEHLTTGLKEGTDLTLGGIYDDTAASGPNAVLNAPGDTRTVTITWGGSKTTSFEAIIMTFRRSAARRTLTKFQCVLKPTGTVTEA